MLQDDTNTYFYNILFAIGGIVGIININTALKKNDGIDYESQLKEKDRIIAEQQSQLEKYKKYIDDNK